MRLRKFTSYRQLLVRFFIPFSREVLLVLLLVFVAFGTWEVFVYECDVVVVMVGMVWLGGFEILVVVGLRGVGG